MGLCTFAVCLVYLFYKKEYLVLILVCTECISVLTCIMCITTLIVLLLIIISLQNIIYVPAENMLYLIFYFIFYAQNVCCMLINEANKMQEKSGLCFEHVDNRIGTMMYVDVDKLVSCVFMFEQVRVGSESPPLIEGLFGMVLYPVT